MAFTAQDIETFIRALGDDPEARLQFQEMMASSAQREVQAALRDLALAQKQTEVGLATLTSRLDVLTARVNALAEAQLQTEVRLARLTERVDSLTERVEALAERVEALAERVEALAEAQLQTETRLARLTERVDALAERVEALAEAQLQTEMRLARLTERVDALTERVDALTERVDTLTARLDALIERVDALTARVDALAENQRQMQETMSRLVDKVAQLDGHMLESAYRDKAASYFGPLVRRSRVVPFDVVEETLDSHLSESDLLDVLKLDLVVRGRPRRAPDAPEVWLAIEVSAVVDIGDVQRAQQRAAYLRRAGLHAVPVVAGRDVTRGADEAARREAVVLLQDGQNEHWEAALRAHARLDAA